MAVDMKLVGQIALILAIIGALNWGLEAINMNAVRGLVGDSKTTPKKTMLETLVYLLVAAAGAFVAYEKFAK